MGVPYCNACDAGEQFSVFCPVAAPVSVAVAVLFRSSEGLLRDEKP
jgi:hypothetical protein